MSSLLTSTLPSSSLPKRRYSAKPFYYSLLLFTILTSLSLGFGYLTDDLNSSPPYHVRRQTALDTIVFSQGSSEAEVFVQT